MLIPGFLCIGWSNSPWMLYCGLTLYALGETITSSNFLNDFPIKYYSCVFRCNHCSDLFHRYCFLQNLFLLSFHLLLLHIFFDRLVLFSYVVCSHPDYTKE